MEPDASIGDRVERVERDPGPPCSGPQTRVLPLSSKRLTATHIQGIAEALELPVAASASDIRLMVEGKLRELGREPMNVQVLFDVLEEGESEKYVLRDASGPFLEVELRASSVTKQSEHESDESEHDEPESSGDMRLVMEMRKERQITYSES